MIQSQSTPARLRPQSNSLCPRIAGLNTVVGGVLLAIANMAAAAPAPMDAAFDSTFLVGGGQSMDLSAYGKGNPVNAGLYTVDVFVNKTSFAREDVRFVEYNGNANAAQPCFGLEQLQRLGVNTTPLLEDARQDPSACRFVEEWIEDASANYDSGALKLYLSIPQAALQRGIEGYVPPSKWDRGINATAVGYSFNSTRNDRGENSSFLGINADVNMGAWQLRHYSTLNQQSGEGVEWQRLTTYVQRPVASLRAIVQAGQISTNGELFDSAMINGVRMASDEKMLPDALRGYAPVVRGVANSNAKVEIWQNGFLLRETTVAPGAFVLDDLNPTGYGGDITVRVTEANGSRREFKVPYASVAQLLRPGATRYEYAAGQIRNPALSEQPWIAQATLQRGLTNALTGYGGFQASDGYWAMTAGVASSSFAGALSVDVTHANATLPALSGSSGGNSVKLAYSKMVPGSKTNISVASYRYSDSGYMGLGQALDMRERARRGDSDDTWSPPQRQRSRFSLSLSQPLGSYGSLYVSGSSASYWDNASDDLQFQAGYGGTVGRLSYTLSATRTQGSGGRAENQYFLNLTMPLGGSKAPSVSLNGTYADKGGSSEQLQVNGSLGDRAQFNYGVTANHDNSGGNSYSANAQYAAAYASLSVAHSGSSQFQSTSFGAQGGMVIHGGGITLTPQPGETMAVVHVPGGMGARVNYDLRVDRRGYAVVPYLTPYRYNEVVIDPRGTSQDVEFKNTTLKVAPYAGAVVKLDFQTRSGRPVLMTLRDEFGDVVPFGAQVTDAAGEIKGLVAQAGQLYLREERDAGRLDVQWSGPRGETRRCGADFSLPRAMKDAPVETMAVTCRNPGGLAGK